MSAIDDPIEAQLRLKKEEIETSVEQQLCDAGIFAMLSLLPFGIGTAIQSNFDGRARRDVERRWIQLFQDMATRIKEISDSIPDEAYYSSEEFRTLLALAYEQLWTTHDRKKLRMLAAALANSGSSQFANDDKELMVRALRNLSPTDVKTLDHENLKGWRPFTHEIEYGPDILSGLARLAAHGLIVETLQKPNQIAGPNWRRTFQLSNLGERFLKFVADSDGETVTAVPKR
jgi:hypothetical protein